MSFMPNLLIRHVFWIGIAIFLLGQVPSTFLVMGAGIGMAKAALVANCSSIVLVGHLLFLIRASNFRHAILGPLAWPILLGVISYASMVLQFPQAASLAIVVRLVIGVIFLTYFLDSLTRFLAVLSRDDSSAPLFVLMVLGLGVTAPLWLGPWAEYLGGTERILDPIIWVSPLTYLAIMADYDYLHSQWFYLRTPLGALRYSYPGQLAFSAAYGLLGTLLWIAERRISMKRRSPAYLSARPKEPQTKRNIGS